MNIRYQAIQGLVLHFAPHEMDTALLVLNFLVDNHESEIAQEQIQYFIDLITSEGRELQ